MNDTTDQQLLSDYAERRVETAFAELVRRHIDLVHSTAFRLTGEAHSAQDVTQAVFLALANNAARLARHPVLPGWLHTTTRHHAAKLVRASVRRQTREHEAAAMHELHSARPDTLWDDLAPHLDAALGELSELDRDAILLRYFEKKTSSEIATTLGISDDAAQKRVHRALERLRAHFAKRRIPLGAAGLATLLTTQAVQAAPAGLAATVSAATLLSIGTGAGAGLVVAAKTIAMTTLQKSLVTATLALGLGFGLYEHSHAARLASELDALRARHTAAERSYADHLARLDADLARQRAEATQAAAETHAAAQDPAIAAIASWVERLQILRTHLQTHPELGIPEFRLLSDQDWIDAAKAPLDTPDAYRRAAAALRYTAEYKFGYRAQTALQRYAAAHDGKLPATTAELAPWFETPPDPDMLARWILIAENDPDVGGVRLGSERVLTQRSFVDEDLDQRRVFGLNGSGSAGPQGPARRQREALEKIGAAYAAAHPGRQPADITELLPYATTPEQQKLLQTQIDLRKKYRLGQAPAPEMDPLVAAAAAYAAAHPGRTLQDELQLLIQHATTPEQKAALKKLISVPPLP